MSAESRGKRWLVCAVLVLQLAARSDGNWLKNFAKPKPQLRIMEGVTEHLHNVMPYEQVQFSDPNVSTAYVSSTKFQAAGMGHLYFITNKFIEYILSDQAFPEGFVDVEGGNTIQVDYLSQQWPTLVSHYWASASVLFAGLVFAVLMPLIGLTLCCCRCAGGCGSRSQPFDAKYDSCKRQFYGILLAGFTILVSFGVVCTFVSNEYLEDGVKELPLNVKKSLNDTRLFINNTKTEVDNLLIKNFDELEGTLTNILEASGEIVKKKLGDVSKASVLSNLTAVVNGLGLIKQDLSNVDLLTRQLQKTALQLDAALKECRTIILKKLEACRFEQACRDILTRYSIQNLTLEVNFSLLPNVTAGLMNISDLITTDIEEEVMKGQQQFETVKTMIQNEVNDNIPEIKRNIKSVGSAIKENCKKVDKVLDRVDSTIVNSYSPMHRGEGLLKEFSPYRYYVCLGVAITLFLILMCLTLGLFCGFCGSRPEGGYHDDCCNKGTGASYLMMAVWLMFLSSAFLMIIALLYFVTGVSSDRIICEPLQNPTPSRVLNIVNRLYDVSTIHEEPNNQKPNLRPPSDNTDFNISSIIRDCHRNMSLFQVLKMDRLIDLNQILEYPSSFGVDEHINTLVSKIRLEGAITILTPDAKMQLLRLAKSPLSSINFPAYTHVLGERITSIDLIQLADALNQTAAQLPSSKSEIKFSLANQAMYLKMHQGQHVAAMLDISQRLESTANQLQDHLRFNHSSLRHAVEHLLIEVEQAQTYLYNEGALIVTKLAKEFGEEFNKHIDQYLQRIVTQIREDVGKCWPMSQAYNATIVAGCKKILNPYNGFWMSVGICTILFMPLIILCVKLASLYQKSESYPGPLVEAEYLYDRYADRENIPLASANHKKKNVRNKPRKKIATAPCGNRSSNVPLGYENMSNSEVTTSNTSANESRHPGHGGSVDYSAHLGRANIVVPTTSPSGGLPEAPPKATWDFPNGGPPHYQNPISSEYERPPPYYYPGPSGPPGAPPESQSS